MKMASYCYPSRAKHNYFIHFKNTFFNSSYQSTTYVLVIPEK
jgi:hypothetical protein